MTDDEEKLREQLHRAVALTDTATDEQVRGIIRDGLRAARRRTRYAVGGIAVVITGLIIGGIAVAARPDHIPNPQAGPSRVSTTGPTGMQPSLQPGGICSKNQYNVKLDGGPLPRTAKPVPLRSGTTISITVTPAIGSARILGGTARIDIDRSRATGSVLKVQHLLPSLATNPGEDGTIHARLRLTDTRKTALPQGQYVISLKYKIDCPTPPSTTMGRSISIAVK